MDTLGYAPESVHQHETWQLGLPAHFPTELPNIAPLSQENIEASLPPQSLLLMYVFYSFELVQKIIKARDPTRSCPLAHTKFI